MNRVVVNVSTGRYLVGQRRLTRALDKLDEKYMVWRDQLPDGCPAHEDVPYAFKAYALNESTNMDTVLWCDASVVPIGPMDRVWEKIEKDGYIIFDNSTWKNYEWTADSAYPDLFPDTEIDQAREVNRTIRHISAMTFGISMCHEIGRKILSEYSRLAIQTKAFCGPWDNIPKGDLRSLSKRGYPCGPPDVLGHRHDETALSVIVWRLGLEITNQPDPFAHKGQESEWTILLADGAYQEEDNQT